LIKIIKELNVEVTKPNIFQAIVAKQYDMNTRFLKVTFVDCGTRIDIPATDTTKVLLNAERADGQSKGFDGVINEDGTVTVPLHSWMLELEGTVVCDISVIDTATDDEKKLTTTSFTLFVEKAAYGGSDVTTDPQYDVLVDLITEVEKIIANGGGSGKSGLSTWKVDVDLSESLRVIPPDLPYIEGRELQVGDLVIDSLGKMYRVIEIDQRGNAGTLEDLKFTIKGENANSSIKHIKGCGVEGTEVIRITDLESGIYTIEGDLAYYRLTAMFEHFDNNDLVFVQRHPNGDMTVVKITTDATAGLYCTGDEVLKGQYPNNSGIRIFTYELLDAELEDYRYSVESFKFEDISTKLPTNEYNEATAESDYPSWYGVNDFVNTAIQTALSNFVNVAEVGQ
jgi:hypothetical protein